MPHFDIVIEIVIKRSNIPAQQPYIT